MTDNKDALEAIDELANFVTYDKHGAPHYLKSIYPQIEIIRQYISQPAQPEWMDISTAPRDGTDIIAYMPQVESECTFVFWKNGFWHLTYDGKRLAPHVKELTHWMPLPAPPTTLMKE